MKKDYYILIKRYGNSIESHKSKFFKPLESDLNGSYHELRFRCTEEEFDKIVDEYYGICQSILKVKEVGEVEDRKRTDKLTLTELKKEFSDEWTAMGYEKNDKGTWILKK